MNHAWIWHWAGPVPAIHSDGLTVLYGCLHYSMNCILELLCSVLTSCCLVFKLPACCCDLLLLQQTNSSLGAWWASVNGKGVWNVTGHTNEMQAAECDEHCNWNDEQVSTPGSTADHVSWSFNH